LLQEVLDEFADGPGNRVAVEARGDLHGEWDRDRLAQVLSNLVGNAVQHGSPDAAVRVLSWGTANDVLIDVHNSGPPISPAALATLFEPMVRHAEDGRSTSLGLGLYIAREIVASHGGTIAVASTTDEGTTFRVRLPRVAKPGRPTDGNGTRAAPAPAGPDRP
jgi:hypothetical protein